MPDRVPLPAAHGDSAEDNTAHHYWDEDAERRENVGRSIIAWCVNRRVRRPVVWRIRMLSPNRHGILCNVGCITHQTGVWYVHFWGMNKSGDRRKVTVTNLTSEADALSVARFMLGLLYP